jgi:hypothetical protein
MEAKYRATGNSIQLAALHVHWMMTRFKTIPFARAMAASAA